MSTFSRIAATLTSRYTIGQNVRGTITKREILVMIESTVCYLLGLTLTGPKVSYEYVLFLLWLCFSLKLLTFSCYIYPGKAYYDAEWEKMYDNLVDYQRDHGTLNVPWDYKSERHGSLGNWVSAIKSTAGGYHGKMTLTDYRVKKVRFFGIRTLYLSD